MGLSRAPSSVWKVSRAEMPSAGAPDEYRRTIELLWGTADAPRRGPKPSLDLDRIARAAGAIADREGLEAVSMQQVARECGVSTMALYRYVPGKAELVALMLDIGLGAPPPLADLPGDWRTRLEAWAARLRAIFQEHPWSLAATAPPRLMGPNELAWFEVAVSALGDTGLRPDERVQAVIAVLLHVRGTAYYAQDSASWRHSASSAWEAGFVELVQQHGGRLPALAEAVAAGAFAAPAEVNQDTGLSLLLDGIGLRIAARAEAPAES
jgi:AcrR family transcriptional regulator